MSDDNILRKMVVRDGPLIGRGAESKLIQSIGEDSIRKTYLLHPDGSETRVHTRGPGGQTEVISTTVPQITEGVLPRGFVSRARKAIASVVTWIRPHIIRRAKYAGTAPCLWKRKDKVRFRWPYFVMTDQTRYNKEANLDNFNDVVALSRVKDSGDFRICLNGAPINKTTIEGMPYIVRGDPLLGQKDAYYLSTDGGLHHQPKGGDASILYDSATPRALIPTTATELAAGVSVDRQNNTFCYNFAGLVATSGNMYFSYAQVQATLEDPYFLLVAESVAQTYFQGVLYIEPPGVTYATVPDLWKDPIAPTNPQQLARFNYVWTILDTFESPPGSGNMFVHYTVDYVAAGDFLPCTPTITSASTDQYAASGNTGSTTTRTVGYYAGAPAEITASMTIAVNHSAYTSSGRYQTLTDKAIIFDGYLQNTNYQWIGGSAGTVDVVPFGAALSRSSTNGVDSTATTTLRSSVALWPDPLLQVVWTVTRRWRTGSGVVLGAPGVASYPPGDVQVKPAGEASSLAAYFAAHPGFTPSVIAYGSEVRSDLAIPDTGDGLSVAAGAIDFLLFDRYEEVYAYIKTTASGNPALTVTVEFVLESPLGEVSVPILSWTGPTSLTPTTANAGGTKGYTYVVPAPPSVLFAPSYCEQGMCPHIAYTSKDEPLCTATTSDGATPVQTILFSGRFLFSRWEKPLALEVPPDADLFECRMLTGVILQIVPLVWQANFFATLEASLHDIHIDGDTIRHWMMDFTTPRPGESAADYLTDVYRS